MPALKDDGPIWLGVLIALGAFALSAATLWNSSRRTTVAMLSEQIAQLRAEVVALRQHCLDCDSKVSQLREENQWLMRQLRLSDRPRQNTTISRPLRQM